MKHHVNTPIFHCGMKFHFVWISTRSHVNAALFKLNFIVIFNFLQSQFNWKLFIIVINCILGSWYSCSKFVIITTSLKKNKYIFCFLCIWESLYIKEFNTGIYGEQLKYKCNTLQNNSKYYQEYIVIELWIFIIKTDDLFEWRMTFSLVGC